MNMVHKNDYQFTRTGINDVRNTTAPGIHFYRTQMVAIVSDCVSVVTGIFLQLKIGIWGEGPSKQFGVLVLTETRLILSVRYQMKGQLPCGIRSLTPVKVNNYVRKPINR